MILRREEPCLIAVLMLSGVAVINGQTATAGRSLSGRVVDAVLGTPIAGAQIEADDSHSRVVATTDVRGEYEFHGLQGDTTRISIRTVKSYLPFFATEKWSATEKARTFSPQLQKEAVISGRVLDSDRRPKTSLQVTARSDAYQNGHMVISSSHSARTNDSGDFRIDRLPPGSYYLVVEPKPLPVLESKNLPSQSGEATTDTVRTDIASYFPSSPTRLAASSITVRAGENRTADLGILSAEGHCIYSSVPNINAATSVSIILSEARSGSMSRIATGEAAVGTGFVICGIPPGSYNLLAFATNGLAPEYGRAPATVTSHDVAVAFPVVTESVAVHGHVGIAGDNQRKVVVEGLTVALEAEERIGVPGESTSARVGEDGEFTLPAVFLGDSYRLSVNGLKAGHYVQLATLADRDISRGVASMQSGRLEITIADDSPDVNGFVLDGSDKPVSNAVVVLATSPLPATLGLTDIVSRSVDAQGHFEFNNIPPGTYGLMAFVGLAEAQATNPTLVEQHMINSKQVTARAKERQLVNVGAVEAACCSLR